MATMKANPPPSFECSWGADPVNRRSIFLIMTSIPDNSFPEIVKMLRHPDPAVRRASADVIGCFGPSKQPFLKLITRSAMPSLIEALKDVNQDVRRSAEEALKKIDPEAAAKAGLK